MNSCLEDRHVLLMFHLDANLTDVVPCVDFTHMSLEMKLNALVIICETLYLG